MDETAIEDIDMVVANEPYPKGTMVSDDGIYTVPFNLLAGEGGRFRGRTSEGILIATNYRLFHSESSFFNIPLGVIDYCECRDIFYLYIYCKDGRTFRCMFDNNECAQKWQKRIQSLAKNPDETEKHFGFGFFLWTVEQQKGGMVSHSLSDLKHSPAYDVTTEAERMGFDLQSVWKISKVNENYELCPSYPKHIIVPTSISDENLKVLAYFRYSKRIPAVVWRHRLNGCVIARSSQPKMGIFGWRDEDDEKLIQAVSDACMSDPGEEMKINGKEESYSLKSDVDSDLSIFCGQGDQNKYAHRKLLIIDARSYAAAMTNRAKGGGYECNVYYPNCEIQYMGLANIHTIRGSFTSVRTLCASPDDQCWLTSLDNTKWLHHISGLIRAALVVVNAVDVEKRPVLVHCSDGWDRTPQIVALAELMLDPYYRTKKGFQVLVEREWLEFGHKFADRCGHSDGTNDRNERSPVFLQWLDCVYQLQKQFKCEFEFNHQYLARLAVHTYSNLFGNFFFNTDQSRWEYRVSQRTFSIWQLLNEKSQFHNYLYNHSNEVLRPSYQIRNLKFWSDVYLADNGFDFGKPVLEEIVEKTNLVKTKSYDNITCTDHPQDIHRHNSNPNLVENSFDPVNYPQVPEFVDKIIQSSSSSATLEDSIHTLKSNNVCFLSNSSDNKNNSERTVICFNGFSKEQQIAIDGSTDTLVSEIGAIINESSEKSQDEAIVDEICDALTSFKPACSVSTSTTDLPLTVENVIPSVSQNISTTDFRLPNWSQNILQAFITNKRNSNASNSCSCSYTTPNHSRTPSSGFPATPCDDPSEIPTLRNSPVQMLDVDGLNIIPNSVQERIKKIILHYKNKVANLQCELSSARYEFLHLCRFFQGKDGHGVDADDAPSLADSACSGEQHADSRGSESSWDFVWSAEHATSSAVA